VDEAIDGGVIVLQRIVEIREEDDVSSLLERLVEEEHVAYVEGIRRVIGGEYEARGRRYVRVDLPREELEWELSEVVGERTVEVG